MGTGFVKFPRWLLEEPYLSELSGNEKILYSLIADRCELSNSTGKCDEDGKPFAVFTIKSIIREYLAQRNAQIIAENTATLEEIYSFWTVTMRDQSSKPADRLKASELLSKALIVERTRKENSDQSGAGHEFDGWSDEELRGAVHLMEDLSDEEFNAIMDAYNRKKRR